MFIGSQNIQAQAAYVHAGQGGQQGRHDKAEHLGCQVFSVAWSPYLSTNCIVNNLDILLYRFFIFT